MKRIKSDKIITDGAIKKGYVYYGGGVITEVSERELPYESEIDATGLYVAPGFIEIHSHGGGGNSFDGDVGEILQGCEFHMRHGVTSILPTLSCAAFDKMKRSVGNISEAMKSEDRPLNIIGAHMEGPYLSLAQTGAQGADFIYPPKKAEYEGLVNSYQGAVARWSYAPEEDEGFEFSAFLAKNKILGSAGHTNATYEDMKGAMEAGGLSLVTHLYSCTSTITRVGGFRKLGVIESAYLEDDLSVEIIADGKHLPIDLIKLIYKLKGPDKIILITDSLSVAGTEARSGRMESTEYIIEDGVCKLADRSAFAGSIATADRLIRVAMEAGIPFIEAVGMMTKNAARVLDLKKKGEISVGMDADIVIFGEGVDIQSVIVGGERKF